MSPYRPNEIEEKWQKRWADAKVAEVDVTAPGTKFGAEEWCHTSASQLRSRQCGVEVWHHLLRVPRFVYSGPGASPGQAKLLENMRETLEKKTLLPHTFLPALFAGYLLKFYYRDFALDGQEGADLTRHSHAHGVATAKDYDRKKALLGILIVHQLYYYLKAGLAKSIA